MRQAGGSLFLRLVWRGLVQRRRRVIIVLLALAVGATLAAALLNTYADLEKKMAGELRSFGANLVVAPAGAATGATLEEKAETVVASAGMAALPFLYLVGGVQGEPAVLAGTRFDRLGPFARAWQWRGRAPQGVGQCAVGERFAAHFRVGLGSRLKFDYPGPQSQAESTPIELEISGVVATGSSEDHQLLLPLELLQARAGLASRISLLQVMAPGTGPEVETARARLAASLGNAAEVRVLRPVAESSARVLLKVKQMLFAITAVVLGISGLCVMTTLSAVVIESRKDIAVMKALGGSPRRITALFLSEAGALALLGGPAGYLAGVLLARRLGQAVFQTPVAFRFAVLPEVVLVTVAVALLATLLPMRLIRHLEPAAILKGE